MRKECRRWGRSRGGRRSGVARKLMCVTGRRSGILCDDSLVGDAV